MKKLLIAGIMAFGLMSFTASETKVETVEDFQTCTLNIVYTNSDGSVNHTDTFTSDQPTLEACQAWHLKKFAEEVHL